MKYKVVYLFTSGSGRAGMAESSFYTRAAAEQSAAQWREISGNQEAFLWDGSSWTTYSPIP